MLEKVPGEVHGKLMLERSVGECIEKNVGKSAWGTAWKNDVGKCGNVITRILAVNMNTQTIAQFHF